MERSISIATTLLTMVALSSSTPKMAPQSPSGRHLSSSTNSKVDTHPKTWGYSSIQNHSFTSLESKRPITVAVIDTGIDSQHPYLKNSLWINPGEAGTDSKGRNKSNNGVDDDRNGFIDDYHGWNFARNNNDLTDHHGHGTHISGIVAAQGPEFSGVEPRARLMVLKYFEPSASGQNNLAATIRAIHYAIDNGAHIINYSSGGPLKNIEEIAAVEKAYKKNVLVVAAAGNEASNSDHSPYYPADYEFPNVISVTAINPQLKILPTSNYGKVSVDIAAPGEQIFSTLPNGQLGKMTGTSQATAFVSGVAAKLLSQYTQSPSAETIGLRLARSGVFHKQYTTKYQTRLQAHRALQMHGRDMLLTQRILKEQIELLKLKRTPAKKVAP